MHLSWQADQRPVWRVRSRYSRRDDTPEGEGLSAAVELEEALRATDKVRRPWVRLDTRAITVSVLIPADSKPEAALNALELIEAVRTVINSWLLGEMMRQTVEPLLHTEGPAATPTATAPPPPDAPGGWTR